MGSPKIIINEAVEAAVLNLDEITLNVSYTEYNPTIEPIQLDLAATNNEFDGVQYIKNFISVYGFNTRIPTTIEFDNVSVSGYIDVGSSSNTITEPPQKEVWSLEFISNSDAFSEIASNLRLDKFLTSDDYKVYRYIRNSVPDYLQTIIVGYAFFITTKELIQQVTDLQEQVKELIVLLSPEPEKTVGAAPSVTRAIIQQALSVTIQLAYSIAILIALNELLKTISDNLFSKPRKAYALDVFNTIQKGCDYIGYKFESDILQNDYVNLTYARAFGYDSSGEPKSELFKKPKNNPIPQGGLLDFINKIALLFNGKLRVGNDKTVRLENREYYEEDTLYVQLSDIYEKGSYSFESSESLKYIYVGYAENGSEKNSSRNEAAITYNLNENNLSQREINALKGASIQKTLDGLIAGAQGNNDSLSVNLPFIFANRKKSQKKIEKFFNSVFDIFAGVNKNYKVKIGDRKDYLMLESDVLASDTIFIRKGEKVDSTSETKLGALNILDHYKVEGMDRTQIKRYNSRGFEPLVNVSGYEKTINNNCIFDENGDKIILTSNSFNSDKGLFELEYKKRLTPSDIGYISPSSIETKVYSNG